MNRPMSYVAAALMFFAGQASAEEFRIGALAIENPWSRATPGGATVGSGYLAVHNTGTQPDRLLGGSVEAAKLLQIHDMTMDGDISRMREITEGIEIKPGQTVRFEPAGTHLMFVGLKKPLRPGDKLSGTLRFERAGTVNIKYEVVPMGANPVGAH